MPIHLLAAITAIATFTDAGQAAPAFPLESGQIKVVAWAEESLRYCETWGSSPRWEAFAARNAFCRKATAKPAPPSLPPGSLTFLLEFTLSGGPPAPERTGAGTLLSDSSGVVEVSADGSIVGCRSTRFVVPDRARIPVQGEDACLEFTSGLRFEPAPSARPSRGELRIRIYATGEGRFPPF